MRGATFPVSYFFSLSLSLSPLQAGDTLFIDKLPVNHVSLFLFSLQALKVCPNHKEDTSNGHKRDSNHSSLSQSNELYSYLIANRSLVLFQLEKYQDCLQEINLALESGYPCQMRDKLYKRRTSCQLALDEKSEAYSHQGERETFKVNKKTTDTTNCKKQIKQKYNHLTSETNGDKLTSPSSVASSNHSIDTFVHASLNIHRDDEKGGERTVRTLNKVNEGELLITESAYTWILHSKYFPDHCYYCLKYLSTEQVPQDEMDEVAESLLPECVNINYHLIPCFKCNQVIFCSITCRDLAWKHFHSTECTFVSLIEKVDDGMFSPFMTLRVILRQGLHSLINQSSNRDVTRKQRKRHNSSSKEILPLYKMSRQSYDNFCQLIYHPAEADTVCSEKATFILAFMLFRREFSLKDGSKNIILGPIDQLSDQTSVDILQSLFECKQRLSEHIRRCQVNSMHITHRRLDYSCNNLPDNLIDFTPHLVEDKIGCGLFLSTAMVNHSCDPNSKCSKFNGIQVYLISNKSIDSSTDVNISYGLFYKYHTLEYRQSELKNNYYFICTCEACTRRWEPIFSAFKCNQCSGPVIEVDKCQVKSINGKTDAKNIPRHENSGSCDESNGETSSGTDQCSSKLLETKNICTVEEKIDERKVHFNEKELNELEEAKASKKSSNARKILSCIQCKCINNLQMKKLTNILNQGNKLLSDALNIIYREDENNVDREELLTAVKYLIEALDVLDKVLYESHMQITIILDYICAIYKKLGHYYDAIKYAQRLLLIVDRHFDEDVNLFNNQFKLLDMYRHCLLRRSQCAQVNEIEQNTKQLLNKFTTKMNTLLSPDSSEFHFYEKYINSLNQLLTMSKK